MPEPIARAYIQIDVEHKEALAALKQTEATFISFAKQLGLSFAIFRQLRDEIDSYTWALTYLSVEFYKPISAVQTMLDALEDLRMQFGYSRKEAAYALATIGDAGYTASESMMILREAMELARATGSDLAKIIPTVASYMAGLRRPASEAHDAMNELFMIMAEGMKTIEDLDLGFFRLITGFEGLGLQSKELAALYTALTKYTGETYNVYLALNAVVKALINPSKKLAAYVREMGYSSVYAAVQGEGLVDFLKKVLRGIERGSLAWTDLISDVRGLSGVMGLLGPALDTATDLLDKLNQGVIDVSKAAETMQQSWGATIDRLKAAISSFLATAIRPLLDALTSVIDFLSKVIGTAGKLFGGIFTEIGIRFGIKAETGNFWAKIAAALVPLGAFGAFLAKALASGLIKGGALFASWTFPVALLVSLAFSLSLLPKATTEGQEAIVSTIEKALISAGVGALAGLIASKIAGMLAGAAMAGPWGLAAFATFTIVTEIFLNIRTKPAAEEEALKTLENLRKALETSMEVPITFWEDIASLIKEARIPEAAEEAGKRFGRTLAATFGSNIEDALKILTQLTSPHYLPPNIQKLVGEGLKGVPEDFWKGFLETGYISLKQLREHLEKVAGEIGLEISPEFLKGLEATFRALDDYVASLNTLISDLVSGSAKVEELFKAFELASIAGRSASDAMNYLLAQISDRGPLVVGSFFDLLQKASTQVDELTLLFRALGETSPELEAWRQALEQSKDTLLRFNALLAYQEKTPPIGELLMQAISEGGAATADQVAEALTGIFVNLATQLGTALDVSKVVQDLSKFAEQLETSQAALRAFGVEVPKGLDQITKGIRTFVDRLEKASFSMETEIRNIARNLVASSASVGGALAGLYNDIIQAGGSLNDFYVALGQLTVILQDNPAAYLQLMDALSKMRSWVIQTAQAYQAAGLAIPPSLQGLAEGLYIFSDELQKTSEDVRLLGVAVTGPVAELMKAQQEYLSTTAKIQALQTELASLQAQLQDTTFQINMWQTAIAATQDNIAGWRADLAEVRQSYENLKDSVPAEELSSLAETIAILESWIREGENQVKAYSERLNAAKEAQASLTGRITEVKSRLLELGQAAEKAAEAQEEASKKITEGLLGIAKDVFNIHPFFIDLAKALLGLEVDPLVLLGEGASWFVDTITSAAKQANDALQRAIEEGWAALNQFWNALVNLAEEIWRIITSTEPASRLLDAFSKIIGKFIDTLFAFLWPLVAIAEKLGLLVEPIDNTTDQFKETAKSLQELNVPAGFKELAKRLEYLVARPGEPYVPPPPGGGGGGGGGGPTLPPIPEWAQRVAEAFRLLVEQLSYYITQIVANLQRFAETIAPGFTALIGAILETFFYSLTVISNFLANTVGPILNQIFMDLANFWSTAVDPFIKSQVLPFLQQMLAGLLDIIQNKIMPFLTGTLWPWIESRLWPKLQEIGMKLLEIFGKFIDWVNANWDKISKVIDKWLEDWVRGIEVGLEKFEIAMLVEAGDFWGAWNIIFQSKSLDFWDKLWLSLGVGLVALGKGLGDLVSGIFEFFGKLFEAAWGLISGVGEAIWGFISSAGSFIWNIISNVGQGFWNIISNVGQGFWSIISNVGQGFWNIISNVGQGFWNIISSIGQGFWNVINNVGQGFWNIISNVGQGFWNIISNVGQGFWNIISNVGQGFWNIISNVGQGFWNVISSFAQGIGNVISSIVQGLTNIWNGFWNIINNALGWIGKIFEPIWNFIKWAASLVGIHLQEGGLVTRPTMALIGEAGPELVIPLPEFFSAFQAGIEAAGLAGEITLVNHIVLEVDGRQLASVVKRQEIRQEMLRGRW